VNAYTAKTTTAALQEFFGDHVVRCRIWPPWSPDLIPLESL